MMTNAGPLTDTPLTPSSETEIDPFAILFQENLQATSTSTNTSSTSSSNSATTKNSRPLGHHNASRSGYSSKKITRTSPQSSPQDSPAADEAVRTCLRHVVSKLQILSKQKANIVGPCGAKQIRLGECIFASFCDLGVALILLKEKLHLDGIFAALRHCSALSEKELALVKEIQLAVTEHQRWFQAFCLIYPRRFIDPKGSHPAVSICETRSGIEFLFNAFSGLDRQFDEVLDDLEDRGRIRRFNSRLVLWLKEIEDRREDLPADYCTKIFPPSHFWWCEGEVKTGSLNFL